MITFFTLFLLSFSSFSQSIVCGQSNCIPVTTFPSTVDIQEKAGFSSIDLNFLGVDLNVSAIPNQKSKDVRMFLLNGVKDDAKDVTIDLSSSSLGNSASNLIMIGDNFNNLSVKMNGYNGPNGKDASEICSENIQSLKYGAASNLKYLQNRSNPANGLVSNRCGSLDVSDLATDKFACNDPNFIDVSSNQSISVERVKKVSKCMAIIPQPICVQPAYKLSCNYEVYVNDGSVRNLRYAGGIFDNAGGAYAFDLFLRYVQNYPTWDVGSTCGGDYAGPRNSYFSNSGILNPASRMYDGVTYFYSNGNYFVDYTTTQEYTLTQTELNTYYSNGFDLNGICENKKSQITQVLPPDIQLYVFHINQSHGCDYGFFSDQCRCENRNVESRYWNSSSLIWKTRSNAPLNLSTPGLDSSGLRLLGGTLIAPNMNAEKSYSNPQGWKMDIMKGFAGSDPQSSNTLLQKTCNTNYNLVSVESVNTIKYQDILSNTSLACNSVKSCDSLTDGSPSCGIDPNSVATFTYIGLDPDPQGRIETVNCNLGGSCPVENRLLEDSRFLDTLTPTNGQSGTEQGSGFVFVYDINNKSFQTQVGQAGAGGKNDLASPTQIKYCAKKRDATTDPNSGYKNDPSVEFKRINWKTFDVNGGGIPGTVPQFSPKKIFLYKKVDPGVLYLLKKELL